jgi:hypothetical protein
MTNRRQNMGHAAELPLRGRLSAAGLQRRNGANFSNQPERSLPLRRVARGVICPEIVF